MEGMCVCVSAMNDCFRFGEYKAFIRKPNLCSSSHPDRILQVIASKYEVINTLNPAAGSAIFFKSLFYDFHFVDCS